LFPNLSVVDPAWRALMRDVRFRRALSLAVDREAVNESLFFGLALEGNNTMLPSSALYKEHYQKQWAEYDPDLAGELLDEIGLTDYNDDDIRLLPDGRPAEIIIETAGEDTEQTDVLELIAESWAEVGIKLYIKPSQRDVFRNRIFSGPNVDLGRPGKWRRHAPNIARRTGPDIPATVDVAEMGSVLRHIRKNRRGTGSAGGTGIGCLGGGMDERDRRSQAHGDLASHVVYSCGSSI
jgi:ABC-type transport system substrate-binding protein